MKQEPNSRRTATADAREGIPLVNEGEDVNSPSAGITRDTLDSLLPPRGGLLADLGGSLIPHTGHLHRTGWIPHMTSLSCQVIKEAAQAGVRTALLAPPHQTPFTRGFFHAGAVVLRGPDSAKDRLIELVRVCQPLSPALIPVRTREEGRELEELMELCGMTGIRAHEEDGCVLFSARTGGAL